VHADLVLLCIYNELNLRVFGQPSLTGVVCDLDRLSPKRFDVMFLCRGEASTFSSTPLVSFLDFLGRLIECETTIFSTIQLL